MTRVLMIPVTRANMIKMIVVGGAGDTMTAHGISSVGTVIMIGARATMTEGLVANHATTIAAMMIDGTELLFERFVSSGG